MQTVNLKSVSSVASSVKKNHIEMMLIKPRKLKLIIACRANITRSAYLHGYFEKCLKEYYPHARKKIQIESAGIEARRGSSAHEVVQHVAKLNGFSLKDHRSDPFKRSAIKRATAILVMEKWQKERLIEQFPFAQEKIYLLMEYLWQGDPLEIRDVPDPTGKNTEDYKDFIDLAHAETERILHELARQNLL